MTSLKLTIVHRLPSRVRLRLSNSLRHPQELIEFVSAHDGVLSARYTAPTRSLVLQLKPCHSDIEGAISRVIIAYSKEYELLPVRLHDHSSPSDWNDIAYSALAVIVSSVFSHSGKNSKFKSFFSLSAVFSLLNTLSMHIIKESRTTVEFAVFKSKDNDGNEYYSLGVANKSFLSTMQEKLKGIISDSSGSRRRGAQAGNMTYLKENLPAGYSKGRMFLN